MNLQVATRLRPIHCEVRMTTKAPENLLNSSFAADWLGLSTSTLAKLRHTGKGPSYVKLGRRVVYRASDLEVWVAAQRHKSTSEYVARAG